MEAWPTDYVPMPKVDSISLKRGIRFLRTDIEGPGPAKQRKFTGYTPITTTLEVRMGAEAMRVWEEFWTRIGYGADWFNLTADLRDDTVTTYECRFTDECLRRRLPTTDEQQWLVTGEIEIR